MNLLNMHISDTEARQLTEKFMAGATSRAEEKRLYRYYGRKHIASDLEENRQMMQWYAAGMQQSKPRQRKQNWRPAAAAAAIIGIATGVGLWHGGDSGKYMAYEGSYVMINGKKVTDLDVIMPYIIDTEKLTLYLMTDKSGGEILTDTYFEYKSEELPELPNIAEEMEKYLN